VLQQGYEAFPLVTYPKWRSIRLYSAVLTLYNISMLTFWRLWFSSRANLSVIFDVQVKHVAKTTEDVTIVAPQTAVPRMCETRNIW